MMAHFREAESPALAVAMGVGGGGAREWNRWDLDIPGGGEGQVGVKMTPGLPSLVTEG